VEEMPSFPGGDLALLNYIAKNTSYPAKARLNNIQGRVIVRFCVNENGNADRISILKGVDPELDAEAVRVVSTLPAFNPGKQGGKAVPVWYMVPLTFTLK
jgi:protein TonB